VYYKGGKRGGNFPDEAEPHQILYRVNKHGVTNYEEYNSEGRPVQRVDVQGASHGGVETPHVIDYEEHTNPATGKTFVQPASKPRAATPAEIPSQAFQDRIAQTEGGIVPEGFWDSLGHDIESSWDASEKSGGLGGDAGDD
jgi:hypothetical protein